MVVDCEFLLILDCGTFAGVTMTLSYLWRNCFVLFIPVLVVNATLAGQLPSAFQPNVFWADIPLFVSLPENVFRVLAVGILPALMPLSISSSAQRIGLSLFGMGTLIYLVSWAALIFAPLSVWGTSAIGFLAPAFTPALWFAGLAYIGDRWVFSRLPYRPWMYGLVAGLFLLFHNAHALIVWLRVAG